MNGPVVDGSPSKKQVPGMYQKTMDLCLRVWREITIFVIISLILQASPFFNASRELVLVLLGAQMLLYGWIGYRAQVAMLWSGQDHRHTRGLHFVGFILRAIPVGILAIMVPAYFGWLIWFNASSSVVLKYPIAFLMISGGILVLLTYVIFLPLVGLWLPAYVAGRSNGFLQACQRGQDHFKLIEGRMFRGPFFVFMTMLGYGYLIAIDAISRGPIFDASMSVNTIFVLAQITNLLFQAFVAVMVAWVLSQSFLDIEDREKSASQADRNSTDLSQLPEGHIDTASDTSQV